jgi:hypothetical protein
MEWIKALPPPDWIDDIIVAQGLRLLRMQGVESSLSRKFQWFTFWQQQRLQLSKELSDQINAIREPMVLAYQKQKEESPKNSPLN